MKAVTPKRGRCLSARDAARYLGISETQMRDVIAAGRIPVLRHPSGRLLGIYEADCDAFLAQAVKCDGEAARAIVSDVDARVAALPGSTRFH